MALRRLVMMLSALENVIDGAARAGPDVELSRATDDSRDIRGGELFVAVRGRTRDGHDFVAEAASRGAAAAAVETPVEVDIPQLVVPCGARALGPLSAALAGWPGERLTLVGITGTNGKTTIAHLVAAFLRAAGWEPGTMGTLGYHFAGRELAAPYTSPPPPILHETLADIAAAGCTHATLEVSSSALAMDRMAGVGFQVGAFSNLSQDHLDVHGDIEAYRAAKARLFSDHLAPGAPAVIFIDDPAAPAMIEAAGDRPLWRVSMRPESEAEIRAERARADRDGVRVSAIGPDGPFELACRDLFGAHNAENLLVAAAIAKALGVGEDAAAAGAASFPGVPGRLERVEIGGGADVFVDYAHTPAALENALAALRPLARGRLYCVFGCGGDRDREKRPQMGRAAEAAADAAIVTSDNPRTEDPGAILADVASGMRAPRAVVADRREAIALAVDEALPGDVVLIAGKGHEPYQIVGGQSLPFDDREEARQAAGRPRFAAAEIAAITGGEVASGDPETMFSRIVIDGRIARAGDLYVAIRGERLDGHDFRGQARAAGAAGALVERGRAAAADAAAPAADEAAPAADEAAPAADEGAPAADEAAPAVLIEVEDTTRALGAIAREHARRWRARTGGGIVAITGSSGKTTSVALTAAALSGARRVHRAEGSYNNETGVPLTLLGLRDVHDAAVVEMGMRGLGQIAYLASLAEPEVGVVLNAGTAHVGVVGSAEAIAQGKSELFSALAPGGAAVFPAGDPRLRARAEAAPRRVSFGPEEDATYRLARYQPTPAGSAIAIAGPAGPAGPAGEGAELGPSGEDPAQATAEQRPAQAAAGEGAAKSEVEVDLPLVGRHNAENAAAAIAAAIALGVPLEAAAAGLARAAPPPMRAEIAEVAGRRALVDCYNANPASMAAALEAIAERRGGAGGAAGVVAILGDMLELGDGEERAHEDAGRRAAELGFEVVAVGARRGAIAGGARAAGGAAAEAEGPEDAATAALARTRPGDWILLKASRGARLERVLGALRARAGGD